MTDQVDSDDASGIAADLSNQVRARLWVAAATLLLGGLVFLAGVSRPVVQDWAEAWDDEALRISIAQGRSGSFRLGFVLMGIGFALMGLSVGMWGHAVSRLETGRRVTIAKVGGALAAIGGIAMGLERSIEALVDIDAAAADTGWIGVFGTGTLSLGFIVVGVLSWRGPAPRWAAVAFALAGLVAVATIPAVYMAGALGFGLVCVIAFRPGKPVHVG